jgi:biopolymer transport protein ExbD
MGATAAARIQATFRPQADPNVIPFIDVLLVLLIIFMVTAPKPTSDLRLDLQQAGPVPTVFIPPTIVDLREAGGGYRLFVSDEETTLEHVSERTLAHMLAADQALTAEDAYAEGRVYVRADLDVAYRHVVAVIDDLQQARFRKVVVASHDANEG